MFIGLDEARPAAGALTQQPQQKNKSFGQSEEEVSWLLPQHEVIQQEAALAKNIVQMF